MFCLRHCEHVFVMEHGEANHRSAHQSEKQGDLGSFSAMQWLAMQGSLVWIPSVRVPMPT